jgi:hypothetical protein
MSLGSASGAEPGLRVHGEPARVLRWASGVERREAELAELLDLVDAVDDDRFAVGREALCVPPRAGDD